ncbi:MULTISPECIES: hypothetical protein [Streptomyces]|uniref:Integral membrane protein n=1 Tax=Streptomyces sudanensis TaxID=436397 RepID=A0ABY4T8N0_9ACTN|nr:MULTISPECIES: hypothetical protein [Streptomyces]MCP9957568.1 hypothetical protein [Streptomyces sudanensis]MCP9986699.1 hypothetical protein [Streptomyces sudanensis]MCQ0001888.1 hypothetical protein [Streptomyces sudanensis]URN15261.1 hypothetical protein MW084_04095 [Streptomyces sudanensis]
MTYAPTLRDTSPSPVRSARFLRTVLRVDGVSTAVTGAVLVAAAGPLGTATGMPVAFSVVFGVLQLCGAAVLLGIARRPVPRPPLVRGVVAVNGVSAVACAAVAFGGVLPLSGFGVVFMSAGALVVAVYAVLEWAGLRRAAAGR